MNFHKHMANFVSGFGSIVDLRIGQTPTVFFPRTNMMSDEAALGHDWHRVGDMIASSMNRFSQENHIELP